MKKSNVYKVKVNIQGHSKHGYYDCSFDQYVVADGVEKACEKVREALAEKFATGHMRVWVEGMVARPKAVTLDDVEVLTCTRIFEEVLI